uniref:Uncharacterized protein n=1 Tax=Arundo donax TaxID=35708 RepID=A0A0A9GKQ6_ARUDO
MKIILIKEINTGKTHQYTTAPGN